MADEPGLSDEYLRVERWRFQSALRLGVPIELALAFAEGDGDLHLLEELIDAGCLPSLAVQIA